MAHPAHTQAYDLLQLSTLTDEYLQPVNNLNKLIIPKIILHSERSPGNLWRLVVSPTPVKND